MLILILGLLLSTRRGIMARIAFMGTYPTYIDFTVHVTHSNSVSTLGAGLFSSLLLLQHSTRSMMVLWTNGPLVN